MATTDRVSESWVRQLRQRGHERGEVEPRKRTGRRPKWTADADTLKKPGREQPDIKLHDLTQQCIAIAGALSDWGIVFGVWCLSMRHRPRPASPAAEGGANAASD